MMHIIALFEVHIHPGMERDRGSCSIIGWIGRSLFWPMGFNEAAVKSGTGQAGITGCAIQEVRVSKVVLLWDSNISAAGKAVHRRII